MLVLDYEFFKTLKRTSYYSFLRRKKKIKEPLQTRDVLKTFRTEVLSEFMQNQLGGDAHFCFTVCQTNGTKVSA